jgi:hypothetical protein
MLEGLSEESSECLEAQLWGGSRLPPKLKLASTEGRSDQQARSRSSLSSSFSLCVLVFYPLLIQLIRLLLAHRLTPR